MRKILTMILMLAGMMGVAQTAYIACEDNSIKVMNVSTNTVITTIPGFHNPNSVSVSPDGTKVYVSNWDDSTISVINAFTNTVTATIGSIPYIQGICFSPDGSKVYAASYGNSSVNVIDALTNTVITSIIVGPNPYGVCVTPDGSKVYVTNWGDGTISVINTSSDTVLATIIVNPILSDIAMSIDGTKVYVESNTCKIYTINTSTNTITDSIPNVLVHFGGMCVSPDGNKLYVVNDGGGGGVTVINTITNTITDTIQFIEYPWGISISPDGTKLYVTQDNGNTLSAINTSTNTISDILGCCIGSEGWGNFISPLTTGIPSQTTPTPTFSLYPNPSKGIFTISTNSQLSILNSQLIVTDVLGNIIYQSNIKDPTVTIDLSTHAKGVYFVKVIEDDAVMMGKVILE